MHDLISALRRFPIDTRQALYLSTLAIPRGALTRALAGARGKPVLESDPALRDPEFLGGIMALMQQLADTYFRWDVRGVERVPSQGPALIVGNHNGGVVNTDSYLTLLAIWNHFGPSRVLCPLSHDLVFFDPVLAKTAARMGVLRAGHGAAAKAFRQGHMALVYPGSDLDAWRRFSQRGRIELGQRKGFLKLVLRERVPIVPVVSAGTHEQFVVLARGDELARRTGVKRFLRAEAVPIVLALPWGLTTGYLPYLPLPAQTTLQFGHPIRFDDVDPGQASDPDTLARCYERVRDEMQQLLDSVTRDRRWLLGQRRSGS